MCNKENKDTIDKNIAISVIIPVYNGAEWIERCLDSLTAQSFQNYEVIVIDDGSTDETKGIVLEYIQQSNSRIVLYSQANAGQSIARNRAMKYAKGVYVAFLDSDDYIDKDYLNFLYEKIEKDGLDCVVCGYHIVSQNGEIISDIIPNPQNEFYRVRFLTCWGRLFRKKYLDRIGFVFPEGKIYEDATVNWCAMYQTPRVAAIKYSGYYYVQREGSSSHIISSIDVIPFEAYEETISKLMQSELVYEKEILSYSIINFTAYMLFCVFRHAPVEVLKRYSAFSNNIIEKYINSPFQTAIRGLRVRDLSLSQRMAVLLLVITMKLKVIFPLSWLVTRF